MKTTMKLLAFLMALVCVLSLLAGCSKESQTAETPDAATPDAATPDATTPDDSTPQETVQLKFYQLQPGLVDQMTALCEEFSATHPGIEVVADRPGDDYFNTLKTMFASNQGPDIFSINSWTMVREYAEAGLALDLSNEDFVNRVPDTLLESVQVDGKTYALPLEVAGIGVLYNKGIFEDLGLEVPTTITELEAVCAALKDAGVAPFMTTIKETWVMRHLWSAVHSQSVDVVSFVEEMNAGTGSFRNDATADAFRVLDVIADNSQENIWDYDYNTGCAAVGEGKAAMYISGLWALDMIKQMDPEIQIGMFALPVSDEPGAAKLSVDTNSVYCVNAKSEHVEEALIFLNWLAETQTAQLFSETTKTIPALDGVQITEDLDPAYKDINQYVMDGKTCPWGFSIWPTGFDDEAGTIIQQYIAKEVSVDEAIEKLDAAWANIIS